MAEIEKQHLPNSNGTLSTTAINLPILAVKARDTRVDEEKPQRKSNRLISYYCLFCSKSFQDSSERDKHQATHVISKAFKCEKCSATFHFKKRLLNHNCTKYVQEKSKNDSPEKKSKNDSPEKKSKNDNPEKKSKYGSAEKILRQYQCQVCLKLFASNANYERHYVGQHSNIKPFACKECGYKYSYLDSLRAHQKLEDKHVNKGKYPCSYCQKVFTNLKCLTQHHDDCHNIKSTSRISTEKKRKWANSSYQFSSSQETNSEKYCDYQSVTSDHLHHQFHFSDASVNVEKIIEDQQLHFSDEAVDLSSMENITNSELEEKPFLCNVCGQCFIIEASLLIHQESQVCLEERGSPTRNSLSDETLTKSMEPDNDIEFIESNKGNWQSTVSQNERESSNVNPWSTVITINTSNKGLDSMQNYNKTNHLSEDGLPVESAKSSTMITINITSKGLDDKQCLDFQKYLNSPVNISDASVTDIETHNIKNISQTCTYEKNIHQKFLKERLKNHSGLSLLDKEKSQSSESIPDLILENFTEKIVQDLERTPPKLPCYGKASSIAKSSNPINASITVSQINERDWSPLKNKRGRPRKCASSGSSSDKLLVKSFEDGDFSLFKVPKLPTIKPSMVRQEDFDISSIIDINTVKEKNHAKPRKSSSENLQWKLYSAKYLPLSPESDATRHSPRRKTKNISYEENVIDDMVFEYESENIPENRFDIIDDKVNHIAMAKKSLAHFNPPSTVSTGLPMCYVSLQKLSQKEIERYSELQSRSPLSPRLSLENPNDEYKFNGCSTLLANQNVNPESQDLKCTFCGQEFTHLKFKRSHMAKIHNLGFQCGFANCNKLFRSRNNLCRHYLGQHIGNYFRCQYCVLTFNYRDGLNLHILAYHLEKLKHACNICNRPFGSQHLLDKHKHQYREKPTCLKKSKEFKSRENVFPSRFLHAMKKYNSCTSNIQKSPKQRSNLSKSLLPVCNLVLSNEPVLVEKIVKETALSSSDPGQNRLMRGDALSCRFCHKKFSKLSGKYIHERQRSCSNRLKDNFPSLSNEHETALPIISKCKISYPCKFCADEFTNIDEKYNHESLKTCVNGRIESESCGEEGDSESLYTSETRSNVFCRFCCKKFKTSVDKRKHENLFHARQKDLIACSFCDKKFRSLNAKSIHIVVAHKGKKTTVKKGNTDSPDMQACEFCGKTFLSYQGKRVHEALSHIKKTETTKLVKSGHKQSKFKCKFCKKVFKTFRGKRVHEVLGHRSTREKSVMSGTSSPTVTTNSNVGIPCRFCEDKLDNLKNRHTHERLIHHKECKNPTEGLDMESINEQELSNDNLYKSDQSLQNQTRNQRRTLSPLKYSEALSANTCSICFKRFYSNGARATHEMFCKDKNQYEYTPLINESSNDCPANLSNQTSKTSSVVDYNLDDSSVKHTNHTPGIDTNSNDIAMSDYNPNDSLVQNNRNDTRVVDDSLMDSHVANSNGNNKHQNRTFENDSTENSLRNNTLNIVPVEGESSTQISIASQIRSATLKSVVDISDPQTKSLANETSPSQSSRTSELSEASKVPSGSVTSVSETSPNSKRSNSDFTCVFCNITFIYLAGKIYHEKHLCSQNPDRSEINLETELGCEEIATSEFQENENSDNGMHYNSKKNTTGYKCGACQNVYENLSDRSLHERSAHFPLEPNNDVQLDKTLPCKPINSFANNELEVNKTLSSKRRQTGDIPGYSNNISKVMVKGDDNLIVDNLLSASKENSTEFFCKFCKKKFNSLRSKNKHERNVRCMIVIDNLSENDQTRKDLLLNVRATPPEDSKNEPVTDFVCKFCNKIFRNLHAKDLHVKIKSCQANSERGYSNDVQNSENSSDGSEKSITAFRCKYCEKYFKNSILKTCHESKFCDKAFKNVHTKDTNDLVCTYCKKTFSNLNAKESHEQKNTCTYVKVYDSNSDSECLFCNNTDSNESCFCKKLAPHNLEDIGDTGDKLSLSNEVQKKISNTCFVCKFCKKPFKNLRSKKAHEKNVRCFIIENNTQVYFV